MADGLLLKPFEVEAFNGHWLATVSSSVDDGPNATLAKDVILFIRVLQMGLLQKEPNMHTQVCIEILVRTFIDTMHSLAPKPKLTTKSITLTFTLN